MFKNLIAFFMALTIMFVGIVTPAYAESYNPDAVYSTPVVEQGIFEKLGQAFIDGIVTTVGTAAGAIVACYALDAAATTVFPPAAALASACTSIGLAGGVAAEGTTLVKGAKAVVDL